MLRLACCVLALSLSLGVTPALAEDRVAARQHYKRALSHYKLAEYKLALDAFKEAFRNFEEPSMLFNVAQCHRQLGQKRDAVRFYRAYLRDVPAATNRAEVEKLVSDLEEQLAQEAAAARAATARVVPAPTPTTAIVASAPTPKQPAYKKWWVWTIVGGTVAVGVGLGVGLTLGLPRNPSATTQGGTFEPFK